MRILFYSDSVPIGGHELMSIRLANVLSESTDFELAFMGPVTFSELLSHKVKIINNIVKPRPLNGSFGMFFVMDYFAIQKELNKYKPDLIVVCQGTIELGIKAVIVARFLGIKVISYIPLVIDLVSTKSKFFPRLRNLINRYLYKLPDGYITISSYHKKQLQKKSDKDISLLHNWAEHQDLKSRPIIEERRDLFEWINHEKASGQTVILIIGRIEFKHKQQDKFLDCLDKGMLNSNISVVFAGIGSDSLTLEDLIKRTNTNRVYYAGMVKDVRLLYSSADGLCICSSFEGVPLVLLEAVNWSLPVFSFDFDAVRDYLPSNLLVRNQDFEQLIQCINRYDFSAGRIKYSMSYKSPTIGDVDAILKQIVKTVKG
ncbi:hypothetical protein KAM353_38050 [Aeromonas caviae]|uniref:glycosyltransferase n=1 Tax=Aeromonas caviae TaxID=648 RepID=UPI001CC76CFA|nr:glycosyltransferase [Aeromonas caviae]GJA74158.1 hypothetical protein KAM353_38050 [Aeromonas caviae]